MIIGPHIPAGGFTPRTLQGAAAGAGRAGGRVREAEIIEPVRRVAPAGRHEQGPDTAARPKVEILAPGDLPGGTRPPKEPASLRDVPRGNPLSAYVETASLENRGPSRGSFFDYSV